MTIRIESLPYVDVTLAEITSAVNNCHHSDIETNALESAVTHWSYVASYGLLKRTDGDLCALCKAFYDADRDDCGGCPLFENDLGCDEHNSPWDKYRKAYRVWRNLPKQRGAPLWWNLPKHRSAPFTIILYEVAALELLRRAAFDMLDTLMDLSDYEPMSYNEFVALIDYNVARRQAA